MFSNCMNKVLIALTTVYFIMNSFTVFASEISQEKYDEAIKSLQVLNIIEGDEAGFRPDALCSRAELAKLLTRVAGLEDIVNIIEGETKFKDVPKDHWSSKYIYVITSLGIAKGTSEDTFEPDADVTYEQAITMLVRALGYEKVALSKGDYPTGYLLEAFDLNITKDYVWNDIGSKMMRKDIALLVYRCLEIPLFEDN